MNIIEWFGGSEDAALDWLVREGLSEEITFELRPKWQIEAEEFPNLGQGNLWIKCRRPVNLEGKIIISPFSLDSD